MFPAPKNSPDHTTRALLEELSGLPVIGVAGDPHGLLERASKPNFGGWLTHAARARGCSQPVRLRGEVLTIEPGTGRVIERFNTDDLPDRVLYKPCGTRLASRCPSCADVYRWDTYQLIKAGLAGGKGVPESVTMHPAVFVTLTAPSFGVVHTRAMRNGVAQPCRPRRDKPACEHGKPLWCNATHAEDDGRLGRPFCLDCYDHAHHVVWNHLVGKLWDRTMLRVRRAIGATGKTRLRLRYAKVAEYQRRGVVHLHALVRLDGYDPDEPEAILAPPLFLGPNGEPIPFMTGHQFADVIKDIAHDTAIRTQAHRANPDGWYIGWGAKGIDAKPIRNGLPGGELTEQHVAGYLAKYATKATEIAGLTAGRRITRHTIEAHEGATRHTDRLILACWDLGADPEWIGMRRWAHMLGFGGHFSTKSRRYSTTLTALRNARRPQNRIRVSAADGDPVALDEHTHAEETVLVINQWKHVGNGWATTGDAALAAMAADAARQRKPAIPPTQAVRPREGVHSG